MSSQGPHYHHHCPHSEKVPRSHTMRAEWLPRNSEFWAWWMTHNRGRPPSCSGRLQHAGLWTPAASLYGHCMSQGTVYVLGLWLSLPAMNLAKKPLGHGGQEGTKKRKSQSLTPGCLRRELSGYSGEERGKEALKYLQNNNKWINNSFISNFHRN